MGMGVRSLGHAGGVAVGYAAGYALDTYYFLKEGNDKIIK